MWIDLLWFFPWTLMLYLIHRLVHCAPVFKNIHLQHHRHINFNQTGWHYNNLFLFNDTWTCTLDLWITEVFPTIIFSAITNQWWLCVFYYVWAAFFQEDLEHNTNVDVSFFTFGRWHMCHHKNSTKNFGLFFSVWDVVFKTELKHNI